MGNGAGTANTSNALPSPPPDAGSGTNRGLPCKGDIRRAGDNANTWDSSLLDGTGSFTSPDGADQIKSDTTDSAVILGGDSIPIAGSATSKDSAAEGSNSTHSPARRG
jgi:hypothetical protein